MLKTERYELKISPAEKALLKRAAYLRDVSMATFVRQAALVRAERVLKAEK